ncbi:MAG: hypothetical protein FWE06_07590 [Oscillospiraceae bacterium]|nr:hypothetical protein [Oscillospiraceae bacterium]
MRKRKESDMVFGNPFMYRYLEYQKKYKNINPDRESMRKLLLEVKEMGSHKRGFALVELRKAWNRATNEMPRQEQKKLLNEIKSDFPNMSF